MLNKNVERIVGEIEDSETIHDTTPPTGGRGAETVDVASRILELENCLERWADIMNDLPVMAIGNGDHDAGMRLIKETRRLIPFVY